VDVMQILISTDSVWYYRHVIMGHRKVLIGRRDKNREKKRLEGKHGTPGRPSKKKTNVWKVHV